VHTNKNICTYILLDTSEMNISHTGVMNALNAGKCMCLILVE